MKLAIYFFLLCFTLQSCASKQVRQRRRAQKLITKAIELAPDIVLKDTVSVSVDYNTNFRSSELITTIDTIASKEVVQIDSVNNIEIRVKKFTDTLTHKEFIKVKADCLPVTEIVEVAVPKKQIIYQTNERQIRRERKLKGLFRILFLVFLIISIIQFLLK